MSWTNLSTGVVSSSGSSATLPFINFTDLPYSGVDDGATDNTSKFLSAVAALNANGGGTLWFPYKSAGNYKIASLLNSQTLATFTNLNGIRLIGEGVTITDTTTNYLTLASLTSSSTTATATTSSPHGFATGQTVTIVGASPAAYNGAYTITVTSSTTFTYTFAGGTSPATGTINAAQDGNLIDFVNCKGIVVEGINFVAPIKPNFNTPHGLWFLNFKQGCSRIRIDASFTGGESALHPTMLYNDPDTNKSTLIDARIDCTSVERPITCEYSGDNSRYLIKCTNAGRPFIIFGVDSLEIRVRTTNQVGSMEIDAQSGKGCSDIRVWVTDRLSTTRTTSNPEIIIQYTDTSPATHRNIYVNLDIASPAGPNNFADGLDIWKLSGGTGDSVGRGHVLDGLTVEGNIEVINGQYVIGSLGTFASPDQVRRISFRNIYGPTTTGGIALALSNALQDIVDVSNCYMPSAINTLTNSSGRVVWRNCAVAQLTNGTADTSPQDFLNCTANPGDSTSVLGKRLIGTVLTNTNTYNAIPGTYQRIDGLANAGLASLALPDQANVAGLLIIVGDGGQVGMFTMLGANHVVQLISDTNSNFSVTAATAGRTNVYWSAGNVRYELENKTGSTANYRLFYLYRYA